MFLPVPSILATLALAMTPNLVLAPLAPPAIDQSAADGAMQPPNDDVLHRALERRLDASTNVDLYSVNVRVENGVATLSGEVDSLLAHDRAVRITSMMRGVRSVVDLMTIAASEVSDDELAHDVKHALLMNATTDSWEIDALASHGDVVLSGKVQSLAEHDLASLVVRGVRGVRSVTNDLELEIVGRRADDEILEDVRGLLDWNVLVDAEHLKVGVRDGAITVSGLVPNLSQISTVASLARVEGARSVDVSALEVSIASTRATLSRRELPSDDELRRAVHRSLRRDPRILAAHPEVTVDHGVVRLDGYVPNLTARFAASEAALETDGVVRVVNLLGVHSARPGTDAEAQARAALKRDEILHDSAIVITTHDGLAILDGEVDSWLERAHAETVVGRVQGVRTIDNRLQVNKDPRARMAFLDRAADAIPDLARPTLEPLSADAALEAEILDELSLSPFLDAATLSISVLNGAATLSGDVTSSYARNAAELAARRAGARIVFNELELTRLANDEG